MKAEAVGAVEGLLGGAGGVAAGWDGVLVAVPAGEVTRYQPPTPEELMTMATEVRVGDGAPLES